jgi:endonuclease YncB( thermonuclease family)
MTKGTLEVAGTITVSQFWPEGKSDADTASIVIDVTEDSFRFRRHEGAPFQVTRFFQGAVVLGRRRKEPVSPAGKMTIRLQGIDAPELHYRPSALSKEEKNAASAAKIQAFKAVNHSYRQRLGATASKALHDFVRRARADTVACRVFTHVDKPNEVFDTYGRFVGDIEITVDGTRADINHWLIENGWAFPGFYASMNDDEIMTLSRLAAAARRARKGIWPNFSKTIGSFDFDLLEPKKGETEVLADDKGSVIFPKLYRRQTNWAARKKAKITSIELQSFLERQADFCFETDDFLENGVASATRHDFADFVRGGRTAEFDPDGLVFSEAKSTIIGPNKKPITDF